MGHPCVELASPRTLVYLSLLSPRFLGRGLLGPSIPPPISPLAPLGNMRGRTCSVPRLNRTQPIACPPSPRVFSGGPGVLPGRHELVSNPHPTGVWRKGAQSPRSMRSARRVRRPLGFRPHLSVLDPNRAVDRDGARPHPIQERPQGHSAPPRNPLGRVSRDQRCASSVLLARNPPHGLGKHRPPFPRRVRGGNHPPWVRRRSGKRRMGWEIPVRFQRAQRRPHRRPGTRRPLQRSRPGHPSLRPGQKQLSTWFAPRAPQGRQPRRVFHPLTQVVHDAMPTRTGPMSHPHGIRRIHANQHARRGFFLLFVLTHFSSDPGVLCPRIVGMRPRTKVRSIPPKMHQRGRGIWNPLFSPLSTQQATRLVHFPFFWGEYRFSFPSPQKKQTSQDPARALGPKRDPCPPTPRTSQNQPHTSHGAGPHHPIGTTAPGSSQPRSVSVTIPFVFVSVSMSFPFPFPVSITISIED
jgi:hypothetical protein